MNTEGHKVFSKIVKKVGLAMETQADSPIHYRDISSGMEILERCFGGKLPKEVSVNPGATGCLSTNYVRTIERYFGLNV
jgi:hypothetical protein